MHIYCSLNSHMGFFPLLRFSHMSYQRDNSQYMLHHFLLIVPLGLKEFQQHIKHYPPHFSHRVFRGEIVNFKDHQDYMEYSQDYTRNTTNARRSFVQGGVLEIDSNCPRQLLDAQSDASVQTPSFYRDTFFLINRHLTETLV